jgi:hypothetical protein
MRVGGRVRLLVERPLKHATIADLEKLVRTGGDPRILAAAHSELAQRTIPRARRLYRQLETTLRAKAGGGGPVAPRVERGSARKAGMECSTLPTSPHQTARKQIEALRHKLLDISNRNPLASFRHSERARGHVRIIDELPDLLLEKFEAGEKLTVIALPEPPDEPADEKSDEFLWRLRRLVRRTKLTSKLLRASGRTTSNHPRWSSMSAP